MGHDTGHGPIAHLGGGATVMRRRVAVLALLGGAVTAAIGLVVLVGWALGIPELKSVLPGLATMKPNTALSFVLLGLALIGARLGRRALLTLAAWPAVALGAATLVEYLAGVDLGIDQRLFVAGAEGTAPPGRMAPTTALCVVLIGVALATRGRVRPGRYRRTDILVLAAATIAFLALIGYLYGAPALYGLGSLTQMSLHTSMTLLLASATALAIVPERGIAGILLRRTAGGVVARRLIPVALGAPVLVGWPRLQGQRAGWYDLEFGLSLMVVAHVVIFTGLAAWIARTLERETGERRAAERSATTDPLTGLGNRRRLDAALEHALAASEQDDLPLSVLALDANGLKALNDTHGHAAGDAALRRLGATILRALRDTDVAARVGGDEFVVLLAGSAAAEAAAVAARMRAAMDADLRAHPESAVAAAIGIATYAPGMGATDLLAAADAALYRAKAASRPAVGQ